MTLPLAHRRRSLMLAFGLALAMLPALAPPYTTTLFCYIGIYTLVALGLVLLTGVAGLISFGQAAFVGLGAYTTAYLCTAADLPPWLQPLGQSAWYTLPVVVLLTAVLAWLIGRLTLRLSGHYLPLGTIAWGISLYYLFGNVSLLGGHTGISGIAPVYLGSWELSGSGRFYYVIWAFALAALAATRNLLDSREGRAIRSVNGGSLMAESMGVHTPRAKMIAFLVAAVYAGIGGWLYAHFQRFVSPGPFGLGIGIEYLFMAVIGGASQVWGALLGATLVTMLKEWLQKWLPTLLGASGNFEIIVFGVLLVLLLHQLRDGLWPLVERMLPPRRPRALRSAAARLAPRPRPVVGEIVLAVRGITKRFGGLLACNDMSVEVGAGELVALIGPNGAGKSTLFDVISGAGSADAGQVSLRGKRMDGAPARLIARAGLARSFQHVRLLPAMSVIENIALGAHRRGHRGVLAAALRLNHGEEAAIFAEAAHQGRRVGLGDQLSAPAGALPLGQQRLVEIARALAADPSILLLDEPAAGLRYLEKQALAELLTALRAEGMAILLVEHDMDFVMGLADRVIVMEYGEKIAEGTPGEVQNDPRVIEAYLGAAA